MLDKAVVVTAFGVAMSLERIVALIESACGRPPVADELVLVADVEPVAVLVEVPASVPEPDVDVAVPPATVVSIGSVPVSLAVVLALELPEEGCASPPPPPHAASMAVADRDRDSDRSARLMLDHWLGERKDMEPLESRRTRPVGRSPGRFAR